MARSRTNTVAYFPHIAKQGKTLFILEGKYGNDGYAFWFKLLEILATTENHYYDAGDMANWEYLLARVKVSEISATEMLSLLANLGNIDADLWFESKIIWCQALIDNLTEVYRKRQREVPKKPFCDGNNHFCDRNEGSGQIPATEMPQSKVKESKVKKRARALSHTNSPPEETENLSDQDQKTITTESNPVFSPETKPEHEQKISEKTQPEEKTSEPPQFTPSALMALWNELGCRPTVIKLTDNRRQKAAVRLCQRADPAWWREILEKVRDLQAKGRPWLTFDFVIGSENNLLKIIEGNYDADFKDKKPDIAENHQQRAEADHYYRVQPVEPARPAG